LRSKYEEQKDAVIKEARNQSKAVHIVLRESGASEDDIRAIEKFKLLFLTYRMSHEKYYKDTRSANGARP